MLDPHRCARLVQELLRLHARLPRHGSIEVERRYPVQRSLFGQMNEITLQQ